MHGAANFEADRTPAHRATGAGARQRRFPIGAAAYAMPRHSFIPRLNTPRIAPARVCTTSRGPAAQPAGASNASTANAIREPDTPRSRTDRFICSRPEADLYPATSRWSVAAAPGNMRPSSQRTIHSGRPGDCDGDLLEAPALAVPQAPASHQGRDPFPRAPRHLVAAAPCTCPARSPRLSPTIAFAYPPSSRDRLLRQHRDGLDRARSHAARFPSRPHALARDAKLTESAGSCIHQGPAV
jgi:hypothetical protein